MFPKGSQVLVEYTLWGPKHLLSTYYTGTWTLWVYGERLLPQPLGFTVFALKFGFRHSAFCGVAQTQELPKQVAT